MTLPELDATYLQDRGIPHEITIDSGMTCVVFPHWKLLPGYDCDAADLLIRLPAGYPDVRPDMWWFDPAIRLTDGRVIPAVEVIEHHLGRPWQRWSRHLAEGQWQSGVDGLESYLALIRRDLSQWATVPVQ